MRKIRFVRVGALFFLALLLGPAASRSTLAQPNVPPPDFAYWTGDTTDVRAQPQGGVCLMGGARENDAAIEWFLRRAGGGDVVVLRASGADGYNSYFFDNFPQARVHSVLTLVVNSREVALDPYVARQLRRAEAVWIAGGDQGNYVRYWKDTPLHEALRHLLANTPAVFGGTSAGCAILGNGYFAALNNTVNSPQALRDPFDSRVTLGANDLLVAPPLRRLLTDTHFDNPDRRGRLAVFLARLGAPPLAPAEPYFKGLGVEEFTAVVVEPNGLARVFGGFPAKEDFAWFVAPACAPGLGPEVLQAGQPLTWDRDGRAFTVYKVAGTPTGSAPFDLRTFTPGAGSAGSWEYWSVRNGELSTGRAAPAFAECAGALAVLPAGPAATALVRQQGRTITALPHSGGMSASATIRLELRDTQGRLLRRASLPPDSAVAWPELPMGIYLLKAARGRQVQQQRIIFE